MSAQGAERPILAPGWLIVVLAAMVCAALWLLYPHRDLERRLIEAGDTELSNNYLINLLRSDPDNPRLRLLLAEHQINRGDTAGASLTLQPALLQGIDPALRQEAAWLHGELLYRQYQDTPETEVARRSQLAEALRPKIAELARQTWPLERQRRLSAMASELDAPGVTLQAGPGEVPQDARAAALFYEKAARQALAQGDHDGSAKLYLKARSSTPDAGEARRYYFAAVATLRSGDKPQEALELAERELGPLAHDRQALELLIALARAANRPDVAERHVRELLRVSLRQWGVKQLARATPAEGSAAAFDDGAWLLVHPARRFALTVADRPAPARSPALPFDDKAYALGYEVFLENGKLEDAWAIANAAVRHSPDDMRWRQRLAQVSEWTGRPGSALENWLRVADATQDEAAWQGVERLAMARFDDAALMATLQTLLQGKPQDLRLRQLLMQRQLLRGDVAGANATLRPLLAARDPALRRAGERLQTQLMQNAYTQLLGQEKVEDAWKVANEAVQKDPASTVWRERLAQVSEWTNRPEIALQNWLALARQTQKEAAWQAVLRLAPGLFDDAALIEALRRQLAARPDDLALMRELVDAQERLGEPQPALDYLREHARTPEALQLMAELAERADQPELALKTWRQLFADPAQITPERALRAAVLALRRGQPELGLQWLEAVQHQMPPPELAGELWRMTGELAADQERDTVAVAAYRKLVDARDATVSDYDGLIQLLRPRQPHEAAQVNLLAWQRFGEQRHLIDALAIFSQLERWDDFAHALQQIDHAPGKADSLSALQRSSEFLRLMGDYHRNAAEFAQALHFYAQALALAPQSSEARNALLWFLIDSNDTATLRKLLGEHERQWAASADLHESLAAAWQALSLPQVALERYLTPHLAEHENDFLWLMNYADALEQNQQSDQAWRLRRHLLSEQWQQARQNTDRRALTRAQARERWLSAPGLDATRRLARARLLMAQRPGDPAREVLRELMRMDEGAPGRYSDAAAETAIGWFQDAEEYNAERAFLWQQYAGSRGRLASRPLWAEITVALAQEDRSAAGQLLDHDGPRLPRYDRVNAAAQAGDVRLAQSEAFEAQQAQRADDPLQEQLTENLLAFSDHAGIGLQHTGLGAAGESQMDARLHLALSPRLALDLQLSRIARGVKAADVLRSAPNETIGSLQLGWRHDNGLTRVQATHRRGYASTVPLLLAHDQELGHGITLGGELGWRVPSDDSLMLRLGGMKTRVAGRVSWQATRQDQITLTQSSERYRLQTGAEVGNGRHTEIEYTHALRTDTPTWEIGAFWSTHRFRRRHPVFLGAQGLAFQQRFLPVGAPAPGIDYFLPGNFQFWGIRLSTNMRYEQDYTRALRPYASIGLTRHSELGAGYDLRLGVAGSVLGGDHLSLSWGIAKSGAQSLGFTRNVQLTYRLHF